MVGCGPLGLGWTHVTVGPSLSDRLQPGYDRQVFFLDIREGWLWCALGTDAFPVTLVIITGTASELSRLKIFVTLWSRCAAATTATPP